MGDFDLKQLPGSSRANQAQGNTYARNLHMTILVYQTKLQVLAEFLGYELPFST